jgi:hypothetical protein
MIKPYISGIDGRWEVLDANGAVVLSTYDFVHAQWKLAMLLEHGGQTLTYFEQKGWDARRAGHSRICDYRGSAGADFRRGWDACAKAQNERLRNEARKLLKGE